MAQFIALPVPPTLPAFPSAVYGELYEATDASPRRQDIATAGTYQGWKDATAGPLRGFTADTSDATADHLTVPAGGEGTYHISATLTGNSVNDAASSIHIQIYVNGASVSKTITRLRADNVSNKHTVSARCNVALSVGDEISLYFTLNNATDGYDIDIHTISLIAVRMGP
jgi:hypothetical protein